MWKLSRKTLIADKQIFEWWIYYFFIFLITFFSKLLIEKFSTSLIRFQSIWVQIFIPFAT